MASIAGRGMRGLRAPRRPGLLCVLIPLGAALLTGCPGPTGKGGGTGGGTGTGPHPVGFQ